MLRSAGYFYTLECPFTPCQGSGSCERPHCQFSHAPSGAGGTGGDSDEAAAAVSHTAAGPPREAAGRNMQELERINKAIEAVKNEVEEKQKKLLLYKNVTPGITKCIAPKIDSNSNILSHLDDDQHTIVLKKRYNLTSAASNTKKGIHSIHSKKYVIDRSCPATDLEYDPLLNYSAGLLGSTAKESESKSKSKCDEHPVDIPHKKPRAISPIRLEIKLQESDDEDVLVIDAPPLQVVSKKPRAMKFHESEEKSLPICDERQPEIADNEVPLRNTVEKIDFISLMDQVIDANKTFDAEKESKPAAVSPKIYSPNSIHCKVSHNQTIGHQHTTVSTDINTVSVDFQLIEQKETKADGPINDLSVKCKQNIQEQTQIEGNEAPYITVPKSNCQINNLSFLLHEKCLKQNQQFLKDVKDIGTIVKNISTDLSTFDETVSVESNAITNTATTKKCQDTLFSAKENDLIVLDSSSEVSEDSDVDIGISDSDDPMEECRRIFNEFAESETNREDSKQNGQEEQSELDILEVKGNDVLPGQKKRIAHSSSAKCDVKSNSSIIVPYRGPAPQQMPHSRILHVQQQAGKITAAVKSGQAFVAAASAQKKITGCISPAFHNFGPMVCVNLVEVQSIMPSRSQFSGFFQGSPVATSSFKSSIAQKRTLQTAPIKISTRKRPSVVPETGAKVPHETRQRYVNSFVEEFLKESTTVQEAFDKALTEEKAIFDRCGSKNMYLNIAVNSLKKLRDQRNISNSSQNSSCRENTSGLRKQDDKNEFTGINLYKLLKEYLLSDEQLQENGFPRPNPEKPGSALIYNGVTKTIVSDALRRVCCRCGEMYSVTSQGKHVRKEECTYHSGRVLRHRVPGGMETRYSCCEAVVGTPGCQVEKLHVHDCPKENLDGFINTFIKLQPSDGNPGVFSLDCEMCYTTHGLEMTRVTVVDPSLQVVYDTFVKPDNEIIDYNTRFSGVTEENLKNITTSIRDVQAIMLNMFSADTILIGHSLENDLIALKLIHDSVVDTSMVFPHRLGLPHKKALRNLMADYLRRIIQDHVGGHDSSEDAAACMELMLWKVKEDSKGRR
ncbi:RNA exonuclease 1 homolog isoform X2 [Ascaphus truei]|uniref:RNA exonuclease 1 homolog isoform X2 n=1 Tax=Ascaphus truei TaxID=8439 RepID=UPI003F596F8B